MMSSTMSKDANDGLGRCHCVEKNLMDPTNKRWVIADAALTNLLGVDRFQGFTVSKFLTPHLLPMDDA